MIKMYAKYAKRIKEITPALVLVTEEDPLARRLAEAENMSKDLKNP